MKITVKTVAGRQYALDVDPLSEALVIKDHIHQEEGISPDQQKLLFHGQELPGTATFESAGVEEGAIIHMTVSLRA
jgi:ubiquitin C